jgi:3-methylcrotonyl-CoA carboxylase alpha subunit
LVKQGLLASDAVDTCQRDPWALCDGWRLSNRYQRSVPWLEHAVLRAVRVSRRGAAWSIEDEQGAHTFCWRLEDATPSNAAYCLRVTLDGRDYGGTVVLHETRAYVFASGCTHILDLPDPLAQAQDTQAELGALTAPMPGKIVSIAVQAGARVQKGQALLVMEAMKMEHTISAPVQGQVQEIFYQVGDQVPEGVELVSMQG